MKSSRNKTFYSPLFHIRELWDAFLFVRARQSCTFIPIISFSLWFIRCCKQQHKCECTTSTIYPLQCFISFFSQELWVMTSNFMVLIKNNLHACEWCIFEWFVRQCHHNKTFLPSVYLTVVVMINVNYQRINNLSECLHWICICIFSPFIHCCEIYHWLYKIIYCSFFSFFMSEVPFFSSSLFSCQPYSCCYCPQYKSIPNPHLSSSYRVK